MSPNSTECNRSVLLFSLLYGFISNFEFMCSTQHSLIDRRYGIFKTLDSSCATIRKLL